MLSLCMIVKNEEASLPNCLNSVKELVDEIVVLDTGSTDRTPEIAREFGAKVHYFKWCDDFSAARNESLKYVQGDWVLILDADEKLTPEIVPQIEAAIRQPHYLVINLVRQDIGLEHSPYSLVSRLFRHHPGICFSRPYYAMLDDSVVEILQREPEWQIGYLPDVAILHHGCDRAERIALKDKVQTAQLGMENYLVKYPNDSYGWIKLGILYLQTGNINQGIELLKKSLNLSGLNEFILYELHYYLGFGYENLQQLNLAKYHYQTATQIPLLPKLKLAAYNNLGNILKVTCKLQAAKSTYETALQIDPYFAAGYYNLGMTLKALGQMEDAIAAYLQAINLNPNYAEAYQNLGVVFLKIGNVPESLSAFQKAIALHDKTNTLEAKRLRQGLAEMGFTV